MAQVQSTRIRSFSSDERGSVAIIFGLCTFVLIMIVGLAIDVGRLYQANNKMSAAIDAAALAAAKGLRLANLNDTQVRDVAQKYFNADFSGAAANYTVVKSIDVKIDRAKGAVEVDVAASVPTLFAGIAGVSNFALPRSAVAIFDAKDLEVGLQLDVTGSMSSYGKIGQLKSATKNLLDILIPDAPTGQKVRIGLAPFSAGVNVGAFIKAVDGNRNAPNTCTYERLSTANEKTDAAPVGPDAYKIRPDLTGAPKDLQDCPTAKIRPLTDDKAALKADVQAYEAKGSTAGQLGASWAWNLVSPNWAGIWGGASAPVAYNDGKTIKSVILMTDGAYNTVGGISDTSSYAPQAIQASKLSVDICNGMKAKGIIVYTVGFTLDLEPNAVIRQRAIDTLNACASAPDKFYRAEDGAALDAAFRQIATDIVSLRLSK
jgi:Flp pilus assembly protein TadG